MALHRLVIEKKAPPVVHTSSREQVCGVHAALKATDAYKGYSGGLPLPGPIKDEILDAAAA